MGKKQNDDVLKRSYYWQYLAGAAVHLCSLCSGMAYGWSSPGLVMLFREDSHIKITSDQGSSLSSILMFGGLFGCILTSFLIDRIGRKKTIILSCVPMVISWAMIYFAQDVLQLYIARFISGISVGTMYSMLPTYLGEIMNDNIRGAMTSMIDGMLNVGILLEYIIGPYVTFKQLALISLIIPLINLFCCLAIPESPYYYLMKKDKINAKKSLEKFKNSKNIDKELQEMEKSINEQLNKHQSWFELFKKKGNINGLLIVFGLMIAQHLTGISAILSYAQTIFEKAQGTIPSELSAIGIGFSQAGASFICARYSDRLGRKLLLIISAFGCFLCLSATGFVFFMEENLKLDILPYRNVPTITLFLFMIFTSLGLCSQPYVYLSELFANNFKSFAICIINVFSFFFEGIEVKMFEVVMSQFGYYVIFWLLALFCIISTILIYLFIPETKGKSLEEIQVMMHHKNNINSNYKEAGKINETSKV